MHFSGMETSVREIPPKSLRTGDLSFFPAGAQPRVLLSPNRGICSCFVIPHLSQLRSASSSPRQPIASRTETAGKCKADGLGFVIFSCIWSFFMYALYFQAG